MGKITNTTWHCKIGCDTSLCGCNPARGQYNIASFSSFFTAPQEDQCKTCLKHISKKGYNIEKLRLHYRAVYERALEIDGGAAGQTMQPYLDQARAALHNHAQESRA